MILDIVIQGKSYESQKYLNELDRAKEQATNAKHERDQVHIIKFAMLCETLCSSTYRISGTSHHKATFHQQIFNNSLTC